jgi:hypothetical protein
MMFKIITSGAMIGYLSASDAVHSHRCGRNRDSVIATTDDGLQYGYATDCARELEERGVEGAHALVKNWIRRGQLVSVAADTTRPVYAMADVLAVESATRRNGKRGRRLTIAMAMTQHLQ